MVGNNIRIMGACGNLRTKSYAYHALKIVLSAAEKAGATTQLLNLQDYNLIFFDERDNVQNNLSEEFRLCVEVQLANGIILATPEYHGSFGGVLKKVLDFMSMKSFDQN